MFQYTTIQMTQSITDQIKKENTPNYIMTNIQFQPFICCFVFYFVVFTAWLEQYKL